MQACIPTRSLRSNYRLGGATPWDAYTILCQMSDGYGVNGCLIYFPVYGHYIPWPYLLDSLMRSNGQVGTAPLLR